ncbi:MULTISPECIES: DMT family transporter [Pontibacillus]|uniref:Membrane protein n=1 Tax=Pontibacillus marinus BH030004 = DSM 16465 TaxID=1385511 RepID=A0A0A5HSF9_9BACI|nr:MULTISPECIES: DMT family transporter [Pontibacillus]KGX86537.1 membrane protein [Pontibacillus marinus BH030004 = DSM 16465]QHE53520.1 EamA-like transporter family protein [Pontibacillus sp. HMF3514]
MNWIMMILVFCGGLAVAIQSAINGNLGQKIGVFEGAFVSFLVGTVTLFLIMLFFGRGNIVDAFQVPKWQLLGGVLGSFFVSSMVLAVPRVGVGAALFTVIVAQLTMSSLIDHFGWLGMKQIPLDWNRLAGLGLMIVAIILYTRR